MIKLKMQEKHLKPSKTCIFSIKVRNFQTITPRNDLSFGVFLPDEQYTKINA